MGSLVRAGRTHKINPQTYLEAVLAEPLTEDSAAEWTPRAWLARLTKKPGADSPPDGDGHPTGSNDGA